MNPYNTLLSSTSVLLSHFCNKTIKSDNELSDYLVSILAKQLVESYKLIHRGRNQEGKEFLIQVAEFDCEHYRDPSLSSLLSVYNIVNDEASSLFSGFYLHGSMATLDYIHGWSDVDILAVIPNSVLEDQRRLLELRSIVQKINELIVDVCAFQHHGLMLVSDNELRNYTGHLLPCEVFSYMKSMKKGVVDIGGMLVEGTNEKLNRIVKVLNFIIQIDEESIMKSHAYNNEYLLSEYRNADNGMFQFKYYIEQFMLLPSLYLSLEGRDCYKKYSFDIVENVFPKEVVDWIDLISLVRSNWVDHPYDYQSNVIPKWIQNLIPRDYFSVGAEVAQQIKKEIL